MKNYDWVDDFYDGYACVAVGKKWGFINERGEQICPIKYDYCGDFHNGFAEVGLYGEEFKIDTNGNEICR